MKKPTEVRIVQRLAEGHDSLGGGVWGETGKGEAAVRSEPAADLGALTQPGDNVDGTPCEQLILHTNGDMYK